MQEYQSFMDLNYGKNKMVSAIDWMPGKRGIVAVAITASHSFDERIQVANRPASSYVLLWTFADPIHPWVHSLTQHDKFLFDLNNNVRYRLTTFLMHLTKSRLFGTNKV